MTNRGKFLFFVTSYAGAELFVRIIQYCIVMYLAACLTKSAFGEFGLMFATLQLVILIGLGGFIEVIPKEFGYYNEQNNLSVLFSSLMILVVLFLVLIVLILTLFISIEEVRVFLHSPSFMVVGSIIIVATTQVISKICESLFRLQNDHKATIVLKTLPLLFLYVGGLLSFVVVGRSVELESFFEGMAVSAFMVLVFLNMFGMKRLEIKLSSIDWMLARKLFRSSLPYIFVAFIGWFMGYGFNYLIKIFYSVEEVADYTLVLQIGTMILLVMGALQQVWYPKLLEISQTKGLDELIAINSIMYNKFGVVVLVFLILLWSVLYVVVNSDVVFFANYSNIIYILPLVFFSYLINLLFRLRWLFFVNYIGAGKDYSKIIACCGVAGIVVGVGLMSTGAPIMIYCAMLINQIMIAASMSWYAHRHWV